MKTNVKFLSTLFAAAILLASCSTDDPIKSAPDETTPDGRVPLKVSSVITRASGDQWAQDDKIGIYMFDAATGAISEDAANRQYYNVSGATDFAPVQMTPVQTIYFPSEGSVNFTAYYPYDATVTADYKYTVNLSDQSAPEKIDLLWAEVTDQSKANPAVAFPFEHMLSHMIINPIAGTDVAAEDLAGMTVTITGMYAGGTFDVSTGAPITEYASDPADIVMNPVTDIASGDVSYQAIVFPGTISNSQINVLFALTDGHTFTWTVPAVQMDPCIEYLWDITLNRTALVATGTIRNWEPNTQDPGTAE